jgi:hypothetical protein
MKIITRALTGAAAAVALLSAAPPGAALADAAARTSPSVAAPGESVVIHVQCETMTAGSATLFGAALGLPARVPMTPAPADGSFRVEANVPAGTLPGHYELSVDCADGSSTTAGLTVVSASGPRTGGGGLALAGRQHAESADEGSHAAELAGWALAGGVLVGGLVIAAVFRRRRGRATSPSR